MKLKNINVALCFFIFSLPVMGGEVYYKIDPILTPSSALFSYNYVEGINKDGKLTGTVRYGSNNQGYYWQDGNFTLLGTLSETDNNSSYSAAFDINDSGFIVGVSSTSARDHAFIWHQNTGMIDLGTLPGILPGGSQSNASAINELNQVVGTSTTKIGNVYPTHAYIWSESLGMRDLGSLGLGNTYTDISTASDINSIGQVVGWSGLRNKWYGHAFLWEDGIGMIDIGTLGGGSNSSAINDLGQVVGYSDIDESGTSWHAFLWDNINGMKDISPQGTLYSNALDINNKGMVVGLYTMVQGNDNAFLYDSSNDLFFDLNDLLPNNSNWNLVEANGINDYGQIIGLGDFNGMRQSFLMTPVFDKEIPISNTLYLFILGIFIVGFFHYISSRVSVEID